MPFDLSLSEVMLLMLAATGEVFSLTLLYHALP